MQNITYNETQKNELKNDLNNIDKIIKVISKTAMFSLFTFILPIILIYFKYNTFGYIFLGFCIFLLLFLIITKSMLKSFLTTIEQEDYKIERKKCVEYLSERKDGYEYCFQIKTEDNKKYMLISKDLEINYINKEIDVITSNSIGYVQFAVPAKKTEEELLNESNNKEEISGDDNIE